MTAGWLIRVSDKLASISILGPLPKSLKSTPQFIARMDQLAAYEQICLNQIEIFKFTRERNVYEGRKSFKTHSYCRIHAPTTGVSASGVD